MAYEIGYRRPPKATQFKKGRSGNPKGRPKGSDNFVTLLERELAQKIVITENGRKKTLTRMQAIAKRMVNGGLQGDIRTVLTLVEIFKRTGQLEHPPLDHLLPDGWEQSLEAVMARLGKAPNRKLTK